MVFINGHDNLECGLVHWLEELHLFVPVPLKKVDVKARVVDFVAQVTLEQEYVNREARPIEVWHFLR